LASTHQRQAPRTPVTLKIKFKSETLDQFIERYSVDISQGGIFIRTKEPLPVGTILRFEFQLKDASPLITGDGTVVWTRDPESSAQGVAPGMGVRFDSLPGDSKQVLERILAHKAPKPSAAAAGRDAGGEFSDSPTRVASGDVLRDLAEDDPGGEFNESPTRVAPGAMLKDLASHETVREEDLPPLAPRSLQELPLRPPAGHGVRRPIDDRTPLPEPMPFQTDADDFGEEAFQEATKVARYSDIDLDAASPAKAGGEGADKDDGDAFDDQPTGDLARDEIIAAADAEAAARGAQAVIQPELASLDIDESEGPATGPWADADLARESDEPQAPDDAPDETPVAEAAAPAGSESDDESPAERREKPSQAPPVGSEAAMERARALAMKDTAKRGGGKKLVVVAVLAAALGGGFLVMQRLGGADEPAAAEADPKEPADQAPVEAAAPPAKPDPSAILVDTDPPGASVEIVGEERSEVAPATFAKLDPDTEYALRVTLPGHRPAELSARPGDVKRVTLEPWPRVLAVRSQPPGASVTVNGESVGSTPMEVELEGALARAERYEIDVRRPGYQPYTQTLGPELEFELDGERTVHEVRVRLARAAQPEPQQPRPAREPEERTEPEERAEPPAAEASESASERSDGEAAGSSERPAVEVLTPRRGGEPSGDDGSAEE
jgi:uncharacterized protein (TIGR02266 family)